MKHTLLLIFLFPVCVFAQQQEVFRIDRLPKEGILLNQGWKWNTGDDPEWAKPEFDDSNWKLLMPHHDLMNSLPKNLRPSGIFWLRLKLEFDKSLNKEILALAIFQQGASEIYMNGKLLQRYGVVSSNPDEVKTFNPLLAPIPFTVPKDSMVVLAVRFSFQNNIHKYLAELPNLFGLTITINTLEIIQLSKMQYLTRSNNSNVFRIGAFVILFISYLALYLYSPFQKANLFFCLFSFSILMADLIQLNVYDHWTEVSNFLNLLFHFILIVGKMLLLTAVYYLMHQKINWLYWLQFVLILISIFSGLILYSFFIDIFIVYLPVLVFLIIHIFPNLINLDIIRITLKAIQSQKQGAWIIALGGIVFLISSAIFVLSVYFNFINTPLWGSVQTIGDLVYNVSWLSIPMAVAIYFGLEVALNNRSLKEKLTEVEQLFAEKQLILSTQKETLERQVAERTAELNSKNRELEIEAALEKIRSRSLAMHRSDELENVMEVMSEKMKELDVAMGSIAIQVFNTETKYSEFWVGSDLQHIAKIKLPYDEKLFNEDTYLKDCWEAKAKGENIINKLYSLEQKNRYFDYVFANNDFETIPQPGRDFIKQAPCHLCNLIIEKNSAVFADNWFGQNYSDDKLAVLKRVAKVFEQAYIRFLDLQKAETQAEQARLHLIQIQTEKMRAEDALIALKSTQAQLIQSEKLASLGELTAGIAHEIQNPLNFVNNFAEVGAEMLGEMEEELDKGDTQEAKAIAANLKTNLEKINHHGKRASGIVKSMLEHSRQGKDAMNHVPTDLNDLADEYLRLAYHGLRAKDSSFNATLETHFEPALPTVEVIPQDIGRVLLNLINNAFYAVNEKAKQGIEGYSPTVTVSTRKLENSIEIGIQDNGNGIPEDIKDKIFQPFFTTKPTGQGTGLGLSLAYEIVTKGHGGKIEAESEVGVGTKFRVVVPFR